MRAKVSPSLPTAAAAATAGHRVSLILTALNQSVHKLTIKHARNPVMTEVTHQQDMETSYKPTCLFDVLGKLSKDHIGSCSWLLFPRCQRAGRWYSKTLQQKGLLESQMPGKRSKRLETFASQGLCLRGFINVLCNSIVFMDLSVMLKFALEQCAVDVFVFFSRSNP